MLKKLLLPANERFKRLSEMLGDTYIGLMSVLSEVVGWKKVNKLIKRVVGQSAPGTVSEARKRCGIKGSDAQSAFAVYAYSALNMTPDWKIKVIEYAPEKVLMNCSGPCVLYSAVKRAGLEKKIDIYGICYASHLSIIKAVSPKLEYSVGRSMCSGDNVCEFVIEYR